MNWFKSIITINKKPYTHYIMAPSIHHVKLEMQSKYDGRFLKDAIYLPVDQLPVMKKISVELNDGKKFDLFESVCNDEHAHCLCWQQYGKKNIKNITIWDGQKKI